MSFSKSAVSPPCVIDPGSCQAVRIGAVLEKPAAQMAISREENDAKQAAYARKRAERRAELGFKDTL